MGRGAAAERMQRLTTLEGRDEASVGLSVRDIPDLPGKLSPALLARFTQFDHDREVALIAVLDGEQGESEVGVAR